MQVHKALGVFKDPTKPLTLIFYETLLGLIPLQIECVSTVDSSNSGDADYNAPSCSATMDLSPGDCVYVTSDDGDIIYCCAGFAGFLVKPDV